MKPGGWRASPAGRSAVPTKGLFARPPRPAPVPCAIGEPAHTPVLLREALAILDPRPGETYADATAGLGGHAVEFARRVGPGGTVVLNDADPENLRRATGRVEREGVARVVAIGGNFADLPAAMEERGLRADVVLADLGFASTHVDDPGRGFSFRAEGPLDMRFDPAGSLTAADLVNRLPERELARILEEFGEERRARVIASKIVAARTAQPITTTTRLAEVVHAATGSGRRPGGIDAATRTFQALRIAVNDELGVLEAFLRAIESGARQVHPVGPDRSEGRWGRSPDRPGIDGSPDPSPSPWLAPGARVAVITFHSLEDRPVKRAFGALADAGLAEHLSRRPVCAGEEELGKNPRARSAKLRALRLRANGPARP